ncbi:hypothetical protein K488DRAFT_67134 [Vararia minispora EC-137]|uniref:Uncharacterized protein n=1 Tax=Vararia minispora EC-137 TaxID=1314806 RepID=A0ACB8QZL2_9AGAM|nr:hypothetical protein K488DRAFT_67134 [Vararia minispora EC-137]
MQNLCDYFEAVHAVLVGASINRKRAKSFDSYESTAATGEENIKQQLQGNAVLIAILVTTIALIAGSYTYGKLYGVFDALINWAERTIDSFIEGVSRGAKMQVNPVATGEKMPVTHEAKITTKSHLAAQRRIGRSGSGVEYRS